MEALLAIVSAGHPMKVELENKTLHFDNGFTEPDDILRFQKHLPELRQFTFRLSVISQSSAGLNDPRFSLPNRKDGPFRR